MSTRIWAPGGAPQEVLLRPVGEPEADVAGALLALHQAGATELDQLADEPMVDREDLEESLAHLRSSSGAATRAISKALDDDHHGQLFVRDVLDDADDGVRSVYVRLTNAKIPPGMALRRAGMVYGVPAREAASFAKLASELRAHPETLTDAADRCLLTYFAGAARDECEVEGEVSKSLAPAQLAEFTRTHPRDTDGRFIATAGAPSLVTAPAGSMLARLRTKLTPKTEPVTETNPEVRVRAKRTTRPVRRTRAAATETEAPARAAVTRAALQRVVARRAEVLRSDVPRKKREPIPPPDPGTDVLDPILGVPPAENYPLLGEGRRRIEVAVVLDGDDAAEFMESSYHATRKRGVQGAYFRVGHLVAQAGNNVDEWGVEQGSHEQAVDDISEATLETNGLLAEHTIPASAFHTDPGTPAHESIIKAARIKMLQDTLGPDVDAHEIDDSEAWIWQQHRPDGSVELKLYDEEADQPTVVVFRIPDARGYAEGSGVQTNYHLQPNMIYTRTRRDDTIFDHERAVYIRTIELRHVDDAEWFDLTHPPEETTKALAGPQLATFNRTHTRDRTGRFVAVGATTSGLTARMVQQQAVAAPVQAPARARLERVARPQRRLRTAPVSVEAPTQRMTATRSDVARATVARTDVARLTTRARPKPKPGLPFIDYDRTHTVLREETFLDLIHGSVTSKDFNVIHLSPRARAELYRDDTHTSHTGPQTHNNIYSAAQEEFAFQHNDRGRHLGHEYFMDAFERGVSEGTVLGPKIDELLENDPSVHVVMPDRTASGHFVRLLANRSPLAALNVIVHNDDVDLRHDTDLVLIRKGTVRYREIAEHDLVAANPELVFWQLRHRDS